MAWAKFRSLAAQRRTAEAQFQDSRSRIGYRPDGTEFWDLKGVDVGIQRNRVFMRDRQTCQQCGRALTLAECEWDHVRSRGMGGDDSLENAQTLGGPTACGCHRKKHVRPRFGERTVEEQVTPSA